MAILEGKVAYEAARRLTSADFSRLEAIHQELEREAAANNADGFFEANQRLSLGTAGDCQQPLSGAPDRRRAQGHQMTRRDSLRLAGRMTQSLTEHRGILAALKDQDGALAEQRMRAHLLSGREALARLASGGELSAMPKDDEHGGSR